MWSSTPPECCRGARDDVAVVHHMAVAACWSACRAAGVARVVQISAAGVSETSANEFYRTKAAGDRTLRKSGLCYAILRPALVVGPEAYGGTALLRALAATPAIQPLAFADSPVQTIGISDVVRVAVAAADGALGDAFEADMAEPDARSLAETVSALRAWLGLPPAKYTLHAPEIATRAVARTGDWLGRLGWRPPVRSASMMVLREGVTADSATWESTGQPQFGSLAETLNRAPATRADRLAARFFLLTPIVVATLAAFWIVSGLVGVAAEEEARRLLTDAGVSQMAARLAVWGGATADIALGLAILYRPFARAACLGMVALTLAYLAGATTLTPHLWADPLGPLIKTLPALVLALIARPLLEPR